MSGENVSAAKRSYYMHSIVFAFFAFIVAYGTILAVGTGWSPIIVLFAVLITSLVLPVTIKRSKRPFRVQLWTLASIALISSIFSYITAHPGGDQIFFKVFGVTPPATVTELDGFQQWYDGQCMALRFKTDQATLQRLIGGKKFERLPEAPLTYQAGDREAMSKLRAFFVVPLRGNAFQESVKWQSGVFYFEDYDNRGPTQTFGKTSIFQNENGEVWVVHWWSN